MMTKEQVILNEHQLRMEFHQAVHDLVGAFMDKTLGMNAIIQELELIKLQAAGFITTKIVEDRQKGQP